MRKPILVLVALTAAVVLAQPFVFDFTSRAEITECTTVGGDGGTAYSKALGVGEWLLRVTKEDSHICFLAAGIAGATGCTDGGTCADCDTGGEVFPAGTVIRFSVRNTAYTVACRSATGDGGVVFTKANGR